MCAVYKPKDLRGGTTSPSHQLCQMADWSGERRGPQKRYLWRHTLTVLGRGWGFEGCDRIRDHRAQSTSPGGGGEHLQPREDLEGFPQLR